MGRDDQCHPLDPDRFLDGFTEEPERQVPVDPDSPLGRAMSEAREAWARPGYQPIDPEAFTVEPIAVELDDE